jgi:hypothetical protein
MLKKPYFFYTFLLIITAQVTLAMSPAATAQLTIQLNNINTQMNAIKRAWNTARIHIKMAEKASTTLYNTIKPVFDKIIASDDFITKMNTIVDMQFDAITNNNTPFREIKTENNLSDFFPNLNMTEYGRKLYSAMANKAYCLLLGQKLADKVKEIAGSIKSQHDSATTETEAQ